MSNQEHHKPFLTIIPFSVRNDTRLSASEKLFYGDLVGLSQAEGYCYAYNKWLAKTLEVSVSTIQEWILKLEKCGHITRDFTEVRRRIFIGQGFVKKQAENKAAILYSKGGTQNSGGGYPENRVHINKSYSIEREKETHIEDLSPEKQRLFEEVQQDIPEDLLPHHEIFAVLQEKANTPDDVAAALDFMSAEIARDRKKKGRQKIQSYVAIFRDKVLKLRKLRLYKNKPRKINE